jgi:peptidoglycan hydrolase-like protein with peptidoglycan-binding domain
MMLRARIVGLVLMAFVSAGPVAAQDVFQVLQSILEQNSRTVPISPGSPASVVDTELLVVQRQLSALGYDVGTPDGIMGPRTRSAIAGYQVTLGHTPTGILTAEERRLLVDGRDLEPVAPSIASSNLAAGFDLQQDMDLPGNDFRSGMNEAALKGGTVDGCMAACAADGRCQAFTFNSAARICFLKTSAGWPTAYDGAVSGVRSGVGASLPGAMVTTDGSRPLSSAEILQLQAGLNQRGYDAGTPDGVMGGRTRQAIAQFLADNPQQLGAEANIALLRAVLGASAGEPDAALRPLDGPYEPIEGIDRRLRLFSIANDPAILDDGSLLRSWFQRDARSAEFGDNFELITAYDRGNSVERDAIVARYRQVLLDEAMAFVSRPENTRFRVTLTRPVQFGPYIAGRGLTLTSPSMEILTDKVLRYRTLLGGQDFGGFALDAPDISAVPVEDEAAAARLIDEIEAKSGNRQGNITVWATISALGVDRNAAGMPLDVDFPMTVSVDKVSLMTFGRDGRSLGEELVVLYRAGEFAPQPISASADALAVAQGLGVPIVDGHIVVPGGNRSDHHMHIAAALGRSQSFMPGLGRLFGLAALRLAPDRAVAAIEDGAVRALLTPTQHLQVFGRPANESTSFANEFDRRRAQEILTGQIVPEIVAGAPSFPLQVVSISLAGLGEYDFSTSSFPIGYDGLSLMNLPDHFGRFRTTVRYTDIPLSLPMDEMAAEAMVRGAPYGQPVVYLATFGTLSLPAEGAVSSAGGDSENAQAFGALVFTPSRAGIFADATLDVQLLAIDPARSIEDPDGPRNLTPPSPDAVALGEIALTTELEMLGHIYDQLVERGEEGGIVESSTSVRSANEFEVTDRRREVQAALLAATRGTIWLEGTISFGNYLTDQNVFDAAEIRFQAPSDNGFSANYHYSLLDPRQLNRLAVPPEDARTIVADFGREASVMARINLVDVSTDASPGTPTYRIVINIEEVLILTPEGSSSDGPGLIARIRTGSDLGPTAAQAPPIRDLNAEALDYLRIKYAPETMDDAAYERMMAARWAMEIGVNRPGEEAFFPAGTDLLSAEVRRRWLPEFKRWANERIDSLSEPLRLDCAEPIEGPFWRSPLRDTALATYADLGTAETLSRVASRFAAPHLSGPVYFEIPGYFMENQTCGTAPSGVIDRLGLTSGERSGAVVRVADIALPGGESQFELDLVVESVEVRPHPEGGLPVLLVNARFARAWREGNPPTMLSDAGDLERLTAEAASPSATAIPPGWDIVGLQPGQTLEEAERIIRDHMDVAIVFERQQGQRTTPYFQNEISYLDASLSEAITLIHEPTPAGDTVFLIARQVGQPADTMPTDDVIAGLQSKYGPERRLSRPVPGDFGITWHSETIPKSSRSSSDMQHCGSPFVMTQGYWTPIEGSLEDIPATVTENLQIRGYLVLPGPSDLYEDSLELGALDCGISLQANKSTSGNNDVLLIQMFDYAGYARAYAGRPAKSAEGAEGSTDLSIKF